MKDIAIEHAKDRQASQKVRDVGANQLISWGLLSVDSIDAGFIDRNGERNSLASIRKNRFTGVLKEVPQSVQEKITEDRKAQGLIR